MRKKAKISSSRLKAMGHGLTLEAWDSGTLPSGEMLTLLRDKRGRLQNDTYWQRYNQFKYRWIVRIIGKYTEDGEIKSLHTDIKSEPCRLNDLDEIYMAEKQALKDEIAQNGYELLDIGYIAKAA